MQVSPEGVKWMIPRSRFTLHRVKGSKSLGILSRKGRQNLEIMLIEDGTPYDGDVMVSPADFLKLGPVPLNELTVVMDVRPVREEMVCCALVQQKPKEGSHWWKICGGTGSHSQQGLHFCGRHQNYLRTQAKSGKVPFFTPDTVACSSQYGLGCFKCLSDSHHHGMSLCHCR
jgi:hypothetical protein